MNRRILIPSGSEALKREGLRERPEAWEDGLRAKPQAGNFEWWYFDALFENGVTAAITFFTKPILEHNSVLKPGVSVTLVKPNGQVLHDLALTLPEEFSASKERCYVRAGESFVRGDLRQYELHARTGDLSVTLNFTARVPAWRPGGTGKFYVDEGFSRYFGWLPVIPHGTVEGQVTYEGKMRSVKGVGYHEHTWGNYPLNDIARQYYRGHAHLGDITLVFGQLTATRHFGEEKLGTLLLTKDSQILLDTGNSLDLDETDFIAHEGGRSYPDGLDIQWQKGAEFARLKLRGPRVTDAVSLMDLLPVSRRIFGQISTNPFHFRLQAEAELQLNQSGLVTSNQGQALFELMLLN
jgi:hypothetical protein